MEENTTANVGKVGRMTAKEQVLAIYPEAHIYEEPRGKKQSYMVIGYYTVNNINDQFCGSPTSNPNRAWRKAWKNIQQDMLEILKQ